jgi:hypothetical protein
MISLRDQTAASQAVTHLLSDKAHVYLPFCVFDIIVSPIPSSVFFRARSKQETVSLVLQLSLYPHRLWRVPGRWFHPTVDWHHCLEVEEKGRRRIERKVLRRETCYRPACSQAAGFSALVSNLRRSYCSLSLGTFDVRC